nr:MAG TPA: hypothetical protein [Caudoviricetes sp.]
MFCGNAATSPLAPSHAHPNNKSNLGIDTQRIRCYNPTST